MFDTVEVILWDFDGVILDSVHIRDEGYSHVLKKYPDGKVEKLLKFQQVNGGLSRYIKFRYFYEDILGKDISNEKINYFAKKYSDYMVKRLTDPNLLIKETLKFIEAYQGKIAMHIVSGSDQNELRYLCEELSIKKFFKSIHGSPTTKTDLIELILDKNEYNPENIVLIGDSINDYEAAKSNNINFYGYNNRNIRSKGEGYITSFDSITID